MLKGWTGPFCLTSTDECSSNPCYNNATCIDGHNSYACTCQPAYTGKYWNVDRYVVIECYKPIGVEYEVTYVHYWRATYVQGHSCFTPVSMNFQIYGGDKLIWCWTLEYPLKTVDYPHVGPPWL